MSDLLLQLLECNDPPLCRDCGGSRQWRDTTWNDDPRQITVGLECPECERSRREQLVGTLGWGYFTLFTLPAPDADEQPDLDTDDPPRMDAHAEVLAEFRLLLTRLGVRADQWGRPKGRDRLGRIWARLIPALVRDGFAANVPDAIELPLTVVFPYLEREILARAQHKARVEADLRKGKLTRPVVRHMFAPDAAPDDVAEPPAVAGEHPAVAAEPEIIATEPEIVATEPPAEPPGVTAKPALPSPHFETTAATEPLATTNRQPADPIDQSLEAITSFYGRPASHQTRRLLQFVNESLGRKVPLDEISTDVVKSRPTTSRVEKKRSARRLANRVRRNLDAAGAPLQLVIKNKVVHLVVRGT